MNKGSVVSYVLMVFYAAHCQIMTNCDFSCVSKRYFLVSIDHGLACVLNKTLVEVLARTAFLPTGSAGKGFTSRLPQIVWQNSFPCDS